MKKLCCQFNIPSIPFYIIFNYDCNDVDCYFTSAKFGGSQTESPIIASLPQGIALEFEKSDAARKLRLMLSELLFVMHQVLVPSLY